MEHGSELAYNAGASLYTATYTRCILWETTGQDAEPVVLLLGIHTGWHVPMHPLTRVLLVSKYDAIFPDESEISVATVPFVDASH